MEYIRVVCTKCGKTLKAPAAAAGKKAICPKCGMSIDVLSNQAQNNNWTTGAETAQPNASPTTRPTSSDTKICPYCGEDIKQAAIICRYCKMNLVTGNTMPAHDSGLQSDKPTNQTQPPEHTVWTSNPTHLAYLPFYVYCGLLMLLTFLFIPLVLIGVILLIWAILDRQNTLYTVTSQRVTQKRGIIGRNISEIDLKDIRNVILQCGVIGRILGYGNVGLATAGHAGVEITIRGCTDPEGIKKMIVDLKHRIS